MRYFVTGGTGFIGSYVVRDLVREGHELTAYDAAPQRELLDDLLGNRAKDVRVLPGDVTDMPHLLRAMQEARPERIVHLVSLLGNASEANPLRTVRINIEGTIHAFEAALAVGATRVVWASSMAVFGSSAAPRGHVANDAPHMTGNLYGACKSFLESLSATYRRERGLNAIGLRFTVVYGHGKAGTIARGSGGTYLQELIDKPALGEVGVLDNGDHVMNFLYIEDVARAVVLAANAETRAVALNITGVDIRVADVAAIVRELLPGAKLEVSAASAARYADGLDADAAAAEIGYRPQMPLREGLRATINALRERNGLPLV